MNSLEPFPDWNSILDSYQNETDRAAAILASSYLESYLGECIKSFLVDHKSIEKIFEGYSALATFSARTDMAFALGLITEELKHNLYYIRKIRNHFAHHPKVTSFADSHVRNLCSNFSLLIKIEDGTTIDIAEDEVEPRKKFLLVVGLSMADLYLLALNYEKRTIPIKF